MHRTEQTSRFKRKNCSTWLLASLLLVRFCSRSDVHSPCVPWDNAMRSIVSPGDCETWETSSATERPEKEATSRTNRCQKMEEFCLLPVLLLYSFAFLSPRSFDSKQSDQPGFFRLAFAVSELFHFHMWKLSNARNRTWIWWTSRWIRKSQPRSKLKSISNPGKPV